MTTLIERLRKVDDQYCAAAADTIKAQAKEIFALMGEVENKADYAARMYSMHEAVKAEREALQAEVERLKQENAELAASPLSEGALDILRSENNKLMTELAALKSAEPVAIVAEVHMSRYTIDWVNGPVPIGTKLYAGAAPQAPAQTKMVTPYITQERFDRAFPDTAFQAPALTDAAIDQSYRDHFGTYMPDRELLERV